MNKYIDNINKGEIERELVFSLKAHSPNNPSRKTTSEACSRFDKLNRNITSRLDKIANVANFTPLRITVSKSSPSYPSINNPQEVLSNISNVDGLRILINFEQYDPEVMAKKILAQNISHLVEISFLPEDTKCEINKEGSSCATVYVSSSLDKAFKIIEDVMLDISMYNTLIAPHNDFSIEAKRAFSQVKIDFVRKMKLESEDWNTNKNKGYVAIAGYFWNNENFNYKEYVNCWLKIKEELLGKEYMQSLIPSLESQLRRYTDWGELPYKSIEKKFQHLPTGEYVLARIFKIPKRKITKQSLLSIFGGKVIKRGKIKIVEKQNVSIFVKHKEYVKLFPVYK